MKSKNGFTLIELMIVMILMGVLATIGVTTFISSQAKGSDAARKANLKALSQALELYYSDKLAYPLDDGAGGVKGCWATGGTIPGVCVKNQVWQDSNGSTMYMPQFPADPSPKQKYVYVSSSGKQYQLYAHLVNDATTNRDPQIDDTITAKRINCGTIGTVYCNYGISSGNIAP